MKKTLVAIAAGLIAATGAYAQTYPAKPVRMVVPWPAGGSNDVVGRVVAQKLSAAWGQQVVVDNRPRMNNKNNEWGRSHLLSALPA